MFRSFALKAADAQAVFHAANDFDPLDVYARELEQAPVISSGWTLGVPKCAPFSFGRSGPSGMKQPRQPFNSASVFCLATVVWATSFCWEERGLRRRV